jgi:hypothetical protein
LGVCDPPTCWGVGCFGVLSGRRGRGLGEGGADCPPGVVDFGCLAPGLIDV